MPRKPRLGQNFLRDSQAIERIAAAVGECSGRTVIEIGPGRGAITRALAVRTRAARQSRLIAVELDPRLAEDLRIELLASALVADPTLVSAIDAPVSVVQLSILDFDLESAAAASGASLLVVGNLPYYLTSEILLHLAAHHTVIDRAVLMVQREVADRITAEPGSRDYGLLSATLQLYGTVQRLFTLPPSAFSPPPDVYSSVVRWHFAPRFDALHVPEAEFIAFLRKCFAQKRKTLANNLRHAEFPAEQIESGFAASGVNAAARAETLSLEQFAALWLGLAQAE